MGNGKLRTLLILAAVAAVAWGVVACPSSPRASAGPAGTAQVTPPRTSVLPSTSPVTLAILDGTLIDGTGGASIADAVVLIAGDRILAVGLASQLAVPPGVRTIDVHGATILPGFINAHVHDGFSQANLEAWARGGVTTVRDESAGQQQVAQLKTVRAQLAQNHNLARLVSAGTMLAVPGGYGQLYVNSPDDARAAVLHEIDEGVDAVKVAVEDGYAGRHGLPKLTAAELSAIVSTAHAHGIRVSGHVTQAAYLPQLLDAGVDDIAHVPYDSVPAPLLEEMVRRGIYLVPTLSVY